MLLMTHHSGSTVVRFILLITLFGLIEFSWIILRYCVGVLCQIACGVVNRRLDEKCDIRRVYSDSFRYLHHAPQGQIR